METVRARIEGKVQGVWFRKYVKQEANKLGLSGWVTNKDDGSVYIESCGTKFELDSFLKYINIGSPLSKVDKVTVEWGVAVESTESFVVKY
ncbi:MAG: acylphosphatase [Candidatus Marinimicrobia bacterium]|jgi:acylphosphatase|nr:acylphosphatase [Candidatus Neomarinimicrobiota bacterium]MBT3936023.1 acylphosphatase [Candidatus Neomarinimicrobiota bacterium]MBT3960482.1 acylphosphatase [Candidatus Neomarinimicrobiota bacterium]MBT4383720.1 acylphosphatase [Candidatus Neomarinimicrobiota bacterium]MBT4636254.1 acylphosphatase [Candidatus Neomarinimicrobiota bacterium]